MLASTGGATLSASPGDLGMLLRLMVVGDVKEFFRDLGLESVVLALRSLPIHHGAMHTPRECAHTVPHVSSALCDLI